VQLFPQRNERRETASGHLEHGGVPVGRINVPKATCQEDAALLISVGTKKYEMYVTLPLLLVAQPVSDQPTHTPSAG
jgi:hypothetical protein